jgi:hypothetical protein
MKGRDLRRIQFPQPLLFDALQFRHGAAKKQLTNATERQPLRLQQPNGYKLEPVLFSKSKPASGHRRIQQPQRPVVADVSFRHALAGLAAGRLDAVAFAPLVDLLGQLFCRMCRVHGSDYDSEQCYCQEAFGVR